MVGPRSKLTIIRHWRNGFAVRCRRGVWRIILALEKELSWPPEKEAAGLASALRKRAKSRGLRRTIPRGTDGPPSPDLRAIAGKHGGDAATFPADCHDRRPAGGTGPAGGDHPHDLVALGAPGGLSCAGRPCFPVRPLCADETAHAHCGHQRRLADLRRAGALGGILGGRFRDSDGADACGGRRRRLAGGFALAGSARPAP